MPYQLVMSTTVITAALCLHLQFKPYASAQLQMLETVSLCSSLLTYILAQLLVASDVDDPDSSTAGAVATALVIIANVVFGLTLVMSLRHEMAARVRLALRACVCVLLLCWR